MRNREKETTAVAVETRIQALMAEKGEVTLKALAMTFNLPPVRLYTVAKQPKEGVVYDAKVFNWEAIERFINRRLGQEGFPATLEEVIDKALVIDAELKEADGRRAANRGTTGGKKIEVDGKMIAERKFTNHELEGAEGPVLVVLKKDPEVYKVVYQTKSHTVLVPVANMEGEVKGNMVKVISNSMLNLRGMGPMGNAKGVEERFNGSFAVASADYASEE